MAAPDNEQLLLEATGRSSLDGSIRWIAEGHPLLPSADLSAVARAVMSSDHPAADGAVQALSAELSSSELDSASVLHRQELLPDPEWIGSALAELAESCGGSLATISASAVRAAQSRHQGVMAALEVLAGVSHKELRERVDNLPAGEVGPWSNSAINRAFSYIDDLVWDRIAPPDVPGAFVPRPLELITGGTKGWSAVETFRSGGVPYEMLLAQRIAGGAWLGHRNRTSMGPGQAVAGRLAELIQEAGLEGLLQTNYGGDVRQADLNELVGGDKNVNLVVRLGEPSFKPVAAVSFSLAKDGGSARKTLRAKLRMDRPRVPVFIVVLGLGFSERRETVDLVREFGGAIYTEKRLDALVEAIVSIAKEVAA